MLLASVPPAQVARTESTLRDEVRLQPASFLANHALGEFYIQNHNLKAAIPYLEKARQIDPAHYENAYDLALAYLQTGMTAQSREVIAALLAQKDRAELQRCTREPPTIASRPSAKRTHALPLPS